MGEALAGRSILITGASSGIGRACARLFARQGATLILSGRSAERLAGIAEELGSAVTLTIAADLSRPAEVDTMTRRTLDHIGDAPDAFLANAGLYMPGEAATGDPDAWDAVISTNVNSVFRACRALLPGMVARGRGDIVVTSSISGHQAIHWEPVYSATKHAVQSFVHGVRRQVAASGVRVGAVAPGMVLNELWGLTDEREIAARVAERKGLLSDDVAEAIVFMLTRPPHVTIRDLVILPQNQDL